MEQTDYDLSIHTNPDARAWARLYTEKREKYLRDHPDGQFDEEENMIGWFANAMMAMHDLLCGQRTGRAMSETREEEAKRKALEKLIHDKRWERDGFGQLKNGKERR